MDGLRNGKGTTVRRWLGSAWPRNAFEAKVRRGWAHAGVRSQERSHGSLGDFRDGMRHDAWVTLVDLFLGDRITLRPCHQPGRSTTHKSCWYETTEKASGFP